MKNKVIVTMGLPASGKSSWAKSMVAENPCEYKRVNKDDLRAMLDMSYHTKGNENFVLKIRDEIITQALKSGKNVIVDDTNIHPKHIAHIKELVGSSAEVEVKSFMHVPAKECVRRDALRKGNEQVGAKVIYSMLKQYKEFNKEYLPELHSNITQDYPDWVEGLPNVIICDIDGTISMVKDRSPYDVSKAMNDEPNKHVKNLLKTYQYSEWDYLIFYVTGRKEDFRELTMEWIRKNDLPCDRLIMRKSDDNRPDSVVKKEIYHEIFEGKYNILFILEDRNRVVEMYRKDLGLPVFQVKEGNY
jgi:predicted kinase